MTEDQNFYLFWRPKWPKNWTTEAHTCILHTSKSTCNEQVKQYWCDTSENFLRTWPKTLILTYFGPKMAPKLGLWGPYSTHCWKYLIQYLWSNTDMKPMKTLWGSEQSPQFWLNLGSTMAPNWTFGTHTVHIYESSPNEHIKQDWCESRGKFLTKYSKIWILTHLEVQNGPKTRFSGAYLLHTYKSSPNELVSQVSSESSRNFSRKEVKTYIHVLTYLALFGPKMGPKIWPTRTIFHTHLKVPKICQ